MTKTEIQDLIDEQTAIILSNQDKLSSSDYKVIKCAEATIQDQPMPYDVNQLIAERKGYRKAINDASDEIERLERIEPEVLNQ